MADGFTPPHAGTGRAAPETAHERLQALECEVNETIATMRTLPALAAEVVRSGAEAQRLLGELARTGPAAA